MKKHTFKIILAVFLAIILALIVSISYFNKPHVNVEKSDADYFLTSQNLIEEYEKDEVTTDRKYSEKILQVEGIIYELSTLKGSRVITLRNEDLESNITCYITPEENVNTLNLKIGQDIVIKGICTGYLLDVIMVKCVLVN